MLDPFGGIGIAGGILTAAPQMASAAQRTFLGIDGIEVEMGVKC
jgi:hypothetical protein